MPGEAIAVETKTAADAAAPNPAAADPKATATPPAPAAPAAKETPAAPAAPAAPAELKLALPKDAAIDQARVDELATFAKANGLTQAAAEKLLERENAAVAAHRQREETALAEAKQAWIAETAKAEDLAGKDGKALVATKEAATKAVKWHNDPQFEQLLGATGFGEHPVVLRFLKHIGDALGEDALPITAAGGKTTGKAKSLADHYSTT